MHKRSLIPSVAVYCDFDGTITPEDVTDVLLNDLADPHWREIEAQWAAGRIGSRECLAQQIPLIRGGWAAIAERLQQVRLDPTFRAFAAWCRQQGIPVRIVSDGLDRVIQTLLTRERITVDGVWANHLEESPAGQLFLGFPYPPTDPECRAGLCKCQLLERGSVHELRIVIGDGRSDLCWAARGDWLFAKSSLLTYCRRHRIPCTAFGDFDTIRLAMELFRRYGEKPEAERVRMQPQAAVHV